MSNGYWAQRQRDALYNQQVKIAEKQLSQEYVRCLKTVKAEITSLYDEILIASKDGTLLQSDLYKYNRFYDLMNELNKHLTLLGQKEIKITEETLTAMYLANSELIGKEIGYYVAVSDKAVKDAINGVWCADGKHWSQRIWSNKALLQERLKQGLVDCVARGVSKDDLVKDLTGRMDVGFREADRIARTELNYVQNKSTYNKYAEAGIKEYKLLAEIDGRTSDICKKQNGKVFRMDEAQVGVNYPPLHPNCRSTVLAIIE